MDLENRLSRFNQLRKQQVFDSEEVGNTSSGNPSFDDPGDLDEDPIFGEESDEDSSADEDGHDATWEPPKSKSRQTRAHLAECSRESSPVPGPTLDFFSGLEADTGSEMSDEEPDSSKPLAVPGSKEDQSASSTQRKRTLSDRDVLESPHKSQKLMSDQSESDRSPLEELYPYWGREDSNFEQRFKAFLEATSSQRQPQQAQPQPPTPPSSSPTRPGKGPLKDTARVCEDPLSPGWYDMKEPWQPMDFPFTATPGPRSTAAQLRSDQPVDFLSLFMSDDLLDMIVHQTNIYAEKSIARLPFSPHSRTHDWHPVTRQELKSFFGLFFLTGLIWKPVLERYWCTEEITATPYFAMVMTRDRFQNILRFIHFNDKEVENDRLHKIRPAIKYLVGKFQEMFQPSQKISVGEGTLLFRGRPRILSANKPTRYGSYLVCDSQTGYAFNVQPYFGKPSALADIVPSLLGGLKHKGYRLYMDNLYNSVTLCNLLLDKKTHVCGTLRRNRGAPRDVEKASASNLAFGDRVVRHTDRVLTMAWRDPKVVRMVTTFHKDEVTDIRQWKKGHECVTIPKPVCLTDYHNAMNGVDKLDQQISCYSFIRKSYKWTTKYMFYMFQVCIFNAFVLYQKKNPQGAARDLMSFIESLIKAWTFPTRAPRAPRGDPRSRLSANIAPRPEVHAPVKIKAGPGSKKEYPTRECKVCKLRKKRSETRYMCGRCCVPLHRKICFTEYHRLHDYANANRGGSA